MNKNVLIGLGIGGAAVGTGIVLLLLKKPPVSTTSTTSVSTTSTTQVQTLFLGISPSSVVVGSPVSITATYLTGAGGTTIKIIGLPSPLSIVTDASGFASTTYTPTKAGTYTVYAQTGTVTSNTITLIVTAQCANNSQCPPGQICSGGKCVPCPTQSCSCGKTWSTSSCSCVTQTPALLQFTSSQGVAETGFDYTNNYAIDYVMYSAVVVTYVGNVYITRNWGSSQPNCGQSGNVALPYTSSPTEVIINGALKDSNGVPICNQTVQIGISNNDQKNTDSYGVQYETVGFLSNANPGSVTANVQTDANGNFSVPVWFFAKVTDYNKWEVFSIPPSAVTVDMLITTQLNATYANLSATALINYTGTITYCTSG